MGTLTERGTERGEFVQVGCTALRDPATGEYLPAVPLYIKAEDWAVEAQDRLINDLGKLFAHRMKQYLDGVPEMGDAMVSDALAGMGGIRA